MENAALSIQNAWKNYKAKKLLKMKLNNKKALCGMRKTKKLLNQAEYETNTFQTYQKYLRQKQLENDYKVLANAEHERLVQEYKPQIMEDISDHIREWFKEFYETVNDFHPYPDSSKTGTVLLLIDETMNLGEFKEYQRKQGLSKDEKKALKEKEKQHKLKEKEKRRKERLKEKKKLKKMRDAGIMDIGSDLKNNHHIGRIEQTISQFSTDWKNVDEYLNKEHVAIKEWVTENELATIHKELRALVDKYMIVEYDLLKEAWCTDNKKPFKPLAKSTDKDSLKKKKKLKRTHDLTEGRTIESLYEELKTAEIIEDYPVKLFEDYLGDINVLADDTRGENIFTSSNPAKADIKMVIQDYLFGMGAFNVEQTKSLCLVGPESNGKKLLCYIIASELGALFIDLSPEKTFRFQEDLKYLIHIVMKVAKALQPTILFIEDAHRVFWKKVPKEQMDILPTLLNNSLRNIIKLIGKKDKIMLMGTSSLPWSANPTFQKLFNTFLLVPESDYGTIFLMWLELLTQNVNSIYFDDSIISVLAKVFQKYHTGDISDNVANSLNISRRLRLHSTPLNPNEFLEYFLSKSKPLFPPEPKILEKYQQWYNKANKYAKSRVNKIAEMNKPKK